MTLFRAAILGILIPSLLSSCSPGKETDVTYSSETLRELVASGGSELFSVDFSRYRKDTRDLPIGVFDSGIGGLTVLRELIRIDRFDNESGAPIPDGIADFRDERFQYLGDQANMPYGTYPSENNIPFLEELILKDSIFLMGNRYWKETGATSPSFDKPPVKAVVIACNTATAYGLDIVREAVAAWELPVHVIGVVEAGSRGALERLRDMGTTGSVAVMATVGTCRSEGYVRALETSSRKLGVGIPAVVQQGCLGLAGAIEGDAAYVVPPESAERTEEYRGPSAENSDALIDSGLIDLYGFEETGIIGDISDPSGIKLNSVENYIRYHTATMVERYRRDGGMHPITAIILGCTHFPFYRDAIERSLSRIRDFANADGATPYKDLIAADPVFIDPAELTAIELYEHLLNEAMFSHGGVTVAPTEEFYISVPNAELPDAAFTLDGGFSYDYKYGRDPGDLDVEYVLRVPMSAITLSGSVRSSIRSGMPEVWERLVEFTRSSPRFTDVSGSFTLAP